MQAFQLHELENQAAEEYRKKEGDHVQELITEKELHNIVG